MNPSLPILSTNHRSPIQQRPHLIAIAAGLALAPFIPTSTSAQREGYNPDYTFPALPPEEAIKTIEVPDGYRLEVIASEPMVEEPTSFAFDGNGALYVCEWRTYMQDEHATGQLDPVSRVVKLVDTNGDGVMDKRTVFIDEVILPRMVLPLHDRVLVSFSNDTSVYAYFDDNNDGVADRRETAFEGRHTGSNIEHQGSGLIWNIDNTICTNDFRFTYKDGKLTNHGHDIGRISQWGLAKDDDGRLYGSSAGGGNPIHGFQLPAGYPIIRINEHARGYREVHTICKVWDQSGGGYKFDEQRVLTEHSASSGQSIFRSHLMPEFYGTHIVAEPVGRFIRMSNIEWTNGHGIADNATPNSEFIRSTDAYFRPVWTDTAPDGTLVFSDMYRGIIQEKAWFPTEPDHPRQDWVARYQRVKKWGMIDVVRHGRIYRLVPNDRQPGPQPRMLDESPAELVAHLAHTNGWWRDTAQMLLVTRGDKSVIPALEQMALNHQNPQARIHAMWTLQGLDGLKKETIIANGKHENPRVRRAAVQLAEPLFAQRDSDIGRLLGSLINDPDAHIQTQIFLACRAGDIDVPEELLKHDNPIIKALLEKEESERLLSALGDSVVKGKNIYESFCAACHGADGKGVKDGDGLLAPELQRSEWFRNNGNIEALARIMLKGQIGPINGVEYGEGIMVPLENTYNDEQIADVLNYVGRQWNDWRQPVNPEDITRIRTEIAGRKDPFTYEELKEIK